MTQTSNAGQAHWSRRALLERAATLGAATALPGVLPRRLRAADGPDDATSLTVIAIDNRYDLDPHTSSGEATLLLWGGYELLIQLDGDRTDVFTPMLAESWEGNADLSSYTFHLAPGAVFHDGTPCDAAAVKASFARVLGLGSTPATMLSRFLTSPDQIAIVDERTIRFDLGQPQPLFQAALASPYGVYIVNPKLVETHRTADDPWAHAWFSQNSAGAGTGPYSIAENLPADRTVLSRFDGYHRGWEGEHLDEIVVRVVEEPATRRLLLERGEAHALTGYLAPEDVAALAKLPSLQVVTYPSFNVNWIVMNAPRLRTVDVRRGFSYAFPYDEVINGVEQGWVTRTGPLPSRIRGYDPDVFLYPTDLARAKELILSGGFAEGDEFDYMFLDGHAGSMAIAQLFEANLRAIGFRLTLTPVDHATQIDVAAGELTAAERPCFMGSWGWWPDYDDPWNHLAPVFLRPLVDGGDGAVNVGLWVNERFEAIMAEAKIAVDEARLVDLMREAQRLLTELDPPCIFIGEQRFATTLAADVRGFAGNPLYLNHFRFYDLWRETGEPPSQ